MAVLVLIVVVMLFGPRESAAAQAFAERCGYWIGPAGGFAFCMLGGYWVARGFSAQYVFNGMLTGIVGAGIDLGILFASGVPFQVIFAVSNVGRVVAGTIGGWIASRPRQSESSVMG